MTEFEKMASGYLKQVVDELRNIRVGSYVGTSPRFTSLQVGTEGDGDYVDIDQDGEITLNGNATVWEDLRVPMTATKLGAANDPGFSVWKTDGAGSQGVYLYWFDKAAEEELMFECQIPHQWKQGSTIYPHVHWIPKTNGGAGAVCRWGLEYTWVDIGGVSGDTTIISASDHYPADATLLADKHYLTSLPTIDGTGKTISSMLSCRVFRDATGALGTDDYDDDAGLLELDFHYEIDSLGSKTGLTK